VDTGAGRQMAKLFRGAGFIMLDTPDPTSRPEWDLADVDRDKDKHDPTRAFWSLQIMAFRGSPKRKEAAAQAVEVLRKQGVEAYYYHGETISSVCVGAWPVNAIKQQDTDGGAELKRSFAGHSDYVQIVTSEALPDNLKPKPRADGRDVV